MIPPRGLAGFAHKDYHTLDTGDSQYVSRIEGCTLASRIPPFYARPPEYASEPACRRRRSLASTLARVEFSGFINPKFLVFSSQEHQNNCDISVPYVAPELKITVPM